jgi:hypothetical protein
MVLEIPSRKNICRLPVELNYMLAFSLKRQTQRYDYHYINKDYTENNKQCASNLNMASLESQLQIRLGTH